MNGFFLASYVVLWLLVIALVLLAIGLLQQLGVVQRQLRGVEAATSSPVGLEQDASSRSGINAPDLVEHDGPGIGAKLPAITFDSFNGLGMVDTTVPRVPKKRIMVVCLSITCGSCQRIVAPLNELAADPSCDVEIIVLLRGDKQSCHAFQDVFPLRVPAICDADGTVAIRMGTHRTPLGVLYDESGAFQRKGVLLSPAHLHALVGTTPVTSAMATDIFPLPVLAEGTETAASRRQ